MRVAFFLVFHILQTGAWTPMLNVLSTARYAMGTASVADVCLFAVTSFPVYFVLVLSALCVFFTGWYKRRPLVAQCKFMTCYVCILLFCIESCWSSKVDI